MRRAISRLAHDDERIPAPRWARLLAALALVLFTTSTAPDAASARPRLGNILRNLKENAAARRATREARQAKAAAGQTGRPVWDLFVRLKKDRPDRIPWTDELEYGETIMAKMLKAYGGELLPIESHRDVWSYVNTVARAVARVCSRPDIPQWKVGIVVNDEVGAISAPGGYVLVTTGALKAMNWETELAGVLAHEMAHVCLRHGLHVIWAQARKNAVFSFLGAVAQKDEGKQFLKVLNGAMDKVTRFELEASKEFEADECAADWMYRAGYHPGGLVRFLKRLPPPRNNRAYERHPSKEARIERIAAYVKARCPGAKQLRALKERYEKRVLSRLP